MAERTGLVTFKGNPLTLIGEAVKVGDKLPPFVVVGNDMAPVSPDRFAGKVLVVSVVPSLDTPICDMQTRRFNAEASGLGSNVSVLTLSMDLPFAQARWCGAAGATAVTTASDYMAADFGLKTGLLIKELRLLARAVLVVDGDGVVRYVQLVPEVAQEPDYDAVLEAVKSLV